MSDECCEEIVKTYDMLFGLTFGVRNQSPKLSEMDKCMNLKSSNLLKQFTDLKLEHLDSLGS